MLDFGRKFYYYHSVLIGQDKHLGRQTFDAYPFFLSIDLLILRI